MGNKPLKYEQKLNFYEKKCPVYNPPLYIKDVHMDETSSGLYWIQQEFVFLPYKLAFN